MSYSKTLSCCSFSRLSCFILNFDLVKLVVIHVDIGHIKAM